MKIKERIAIVLAILGLLIVLLSIPLPQKIAPQCKVCHCGKTQCHRECGEDNMCNLKCEGLCKR